MLQHGRRSVAAIYQLESVGIILTAIMTMTYRALLVGSELYSLALLCIGRLALAYRSHVTPTRRQISLSALPASRNQRQHHFMINHGTWLHFPGLPEHRRPENSGLRKQRSAPPYGPRGSRRRILGLCVFTKCLINSLFSKQCPSCIEYFQIHDDSSTVGTIINRFS